MIKIYSTPHVYFDAQLLKVTLQKLGYASMTVTEIDPRDESIHIIYTAAELKQFPPRYIIYQTEAYNSKWFTPFYLEAIRKAMAVWDYSEMNCHKYYHLNANISVVPPGIWTGNSKPEKNGCVFYGRIAPNGYREKILNRVKRAVYFNAITDRFGPQMATVLFVTKVVLNVHYYENAPLEVFRINEALSHGCKVVSQPGAGMERYAGIVRFGNTIDELTGLIKEALQDNTEYNISHLDNTAYIERAIHYKPATVIY